MNIRKLEDLTKEELIELIRHERESRFGVTITDTQRIDWLIANKAKIKISEDELYRFTVIPSGSKGQGCISPYLREAIDYFLLSEQRRF